MDEIILSVEGGRIGWNTRPRRDVFVFTTTLNMERTSEPALVWVNGQLEPKLEMEPFELCRGVDIHTSAQVPEILVLGFAQRFRVTERAFVTCGGEWRLWSLGEQESVEVIDYRIGKLIDESPLIELLLRDGELISNGPAATHTTAEIIEYMVQELKLRDSVRSLEAQIEA